MLDSKEFIREMKIEDIDRVVSIHQQAFPKFFLTRMGQSFLRRYYLTVLEHSGSIALVSEDVQNKEVSGFSVGFSRPDEFYDLFSRRKRTLIPAAILAVLKDPRLIPAVLANVVRVDALSRRAIESVELSSIAVVGQGRGIGGRLLDAFAAEAARIGANEVVLTTDADQNDAVRSFYENRGFTLRAMEKRGVRELCYYTRELR